MTHDEPRGSASDSAAGQLEGAIEGYLRDKGKGPSSESGTYRRNAGRELEGFAAWLRAEGQSLASLDARTLRRYIREELLTRELSPVTARKYYDYISAFIGWCEREGLVDDHYGTRTVAREPLPDTDERRAHQQQTWRPEQRQALLAFVDERTHDAIEAAPKHALKPARDRAMVYLLAYSGVRGGEILAHPDDVRRTGVTWGDFAADYSTVTVLAKDQGIEERAVPPQVRSAVEIWRKILSPAEHWPVIPTLHYATLYEPLKEADIDVESLAGHRAIFDAFAAHDLAPPALTTAGARKRMGALTAEAGIEVEEGYLQPHGARRGAGRVLALEQGAFAAADQLGDSVRTIETAYSDVLASERAEQTGEAFERHDSNHSPE